MRESTRVCERVCGQQTNKQTPSSKGLVVVVCFISKTPQQTKNKKENEGERKKRKAHTTNNNTQNTNNTKPKKGDVV